MSVCLSHFCRWILHSSFDDFASLQGGGGVAIKTGGETKTDKQAEANFKNSIETCLLRLASFASSQAVE